MLRRLLARRTLTQHLVCNSIYIVKSFSLISKFARIILNETQTHNLSYLLRTIKFHIEYFMKSWIKGRITLYVIGMLEDEIGTWCNKTRDKRHWIKNGIKRNHGGKYESFQRRASSKQEAWYVPKESLWHPSSKCLPHIHQLLSALCEFHSRVECTRELS